MDSDRLPLRPALLPLTEAHRARAARAFVALSERPPPIPFANGIIEQDGILYRSDRPNWIDHSNIFRSADRIDFHAYETIGGSLGHTSGLSRVDFGGRMANRNSFGSCDQKILRWYFLAACRHIDKAMTDDAREVLDAAEKHLWGELSDEDAKTAEATLMAKVLVSLGVRVDQDWSHIGADLEQARNVSGPERLKQDAALVALKTFIPDVSSLGARQATAGLIATFEQAAAALLPTPDRQSSHVWWSTMVAERKWLHALQKHMWPPLRHQYPGTPSLNIAELAVALAKGADCAFALADALREGPAAGDKKYMTRAVKHFLASSYHPRGCKYLEAILAPRASPSDKEGVVVKNGETLNVSGPTFILE